MAANLSLANDALMVDDLRRCLSKVHGGKDNGAAPIICGDVVLGERHDMNLADKLLAKMAADPRFAPKTGPAGERGPPGPQAEISTETLQLIINQVVEQLADRMATDERFFG